MRKCSASTSDVLRAHIGRTSGVWRTYFGRTSDVRRTYGGCARMYFESKTKYAARVYYRLTADATR
eukprot:3944291-Alexandrium_andersonii.AAC.1